MKIEEAILYCLVSQNRRTSESRIKLACILPSEEEEDEVNRGMRTEQIAEMINRQRLHIRKDGQPVTSNQVYAVICRFPEPTNEREQNQACLCYAERGGGGRSQMFVKAEGRIMLMI